MQTTCPLKTAFLFGIGIWISAHLSAQTEWTRYTGNPVFTPPGCGPGWDCGRVGSVSVLLDGDTYKMWYLGSDNGGFFSLGYATSSDGIAWTRYANNPIFTPPGCGPGWDCGYVGSVSVLLDGGTYRMWYLGSDNGGFFSLGYATSKNTEAIGINTRCGYAPLQVGCTLNSSVDATAVLWDFGDGSSSAERNPQHTYAGAGSYNITASVLSNGGKSFVLDGGTVVVHGQSPAAKFTMTPRSGAAPLVVHFTDASDGEIVSRLWEFGDGSTSVEANPTHTYTAAESYEARLTATGPCPGSPENLSSATDVVLTGSLPSAELVQAGPHCVRLVVTTPFALKGGEVGLAYDPAVLVPVTVKPGLDLPPDAVVRFQSAPQNACLPDLGVAAGFTVGWINSANGDVLTPPGRRELLKVCFQLAAGAPLGSCAQLRFVECLGVPGAPVRNVVTDAQDRSIKLFALDGQACVLPDLPFRRGDANQDGNFDISDSIGILGCLFLGTACPACPDAADSNDDGRVNISDPVYLLNWRFSGGTPPPSPFSECGVDPTSDTLEDCESFGPCS